MPFPTKLEKAELREIDLDNPHAGPKKPDRTVRVQFNPETLTVNYRCHKDGGTQPGGSAVQYIGQGTTTLSLDLWFDVTVHKDITVGIEGVSITSVDDVRLLTEKVKYFVKPVKKEKNKWNVPAVRFLWGTFIFDGVVDSINERMEYFSEDGKPLRAMLTISIASQVIQFQRENRRLGGVLDMLTSGVRPQLQVKAGDTMQQLAAKLGKTNEWKQIAEANGVENPRHLPPGTLLNLNRKFF